MHHILSGSGSLECNLPNVSLKREQRFCSGGINFAPCCNNSVLEKTLWAFQKTGSGKSGCHEGLVLQLAMNECHVAQVLWQKITECGITASSVIVTTHCSIAYTASSVVTASH